MAPIQEAPEMQTRREMLARSAQVAGVMANAVKAPGRRRAHRVDANINTRVKMGQSSNIFAVAIMNNGKVLYAAKEIKVMLGGCGG